MNYNQEQEKAFLRDKNKLESNTSTLYIKVKIKRKEIINQ